MIWMEHLDDARARVTTTVQCQAHRCIRVFVLLRYETTMVEGNVLKPVETKMQFRTERKVPKVRLFNLAPFPIFVSVLRC